MAKSPSVREFMIEHPYTIKFTDTVSVAEKVMQVHRIRHLPVVECKKVVGIISDRDIMVAKNVFKNKLIEGRVLVQDICLSEPCTVEESTSMEKVAREMSRNRWDAVVVVKDDIPVGIFTTVDACRLLAERFHGIQKPVGFFEALRRRLA